MNKQDLITKIAQETGISKTNATAAAIGSQRSGIRTRGSGSAPSGRSVSHAAALWAPSRPG